MKFIINFQWSNNNLSGRGKIGASLKAVRALEVLKHREFLNESVAYEVHDNLLEDLALKLNGF